MWQGLILVSLICAFHGVTSDTAGDLKKIVDDFWDWRLKESPEFGTKYGLFVHEDKVEEYTFAAFDRTKKKADELYDRLMKLADVKLKGQDQMNYTVLKSLLEAYRAGYKFRYYGPMNPANSMDTPISDWSNLISWMRKKSTADFNNILSRMDKIPAQMEQFIVFLQKAIDTKTTNHEKSMTGVVKKFDDFIAKQPKDTFFYAPFKNMPSTVDPSSQSSLQKAAETVIKDKVIPAFRNLRDFIVNTYMKNLRPYMAATSMPNGKEYYKACLKWHLSNDLTPHEIHQMGIKDVNSIAAKMRKIMKDDNFHGSIAEYVAKLNADPANHYKTEDGMLQGFRNLINNVIKHKLGLVLPIDSVPKLKLEVRKSPNKGGATGRYTEPPVDGSRPGIFWANVYKPETRAKYEMMSLSLHEAEPGHHTQASYNYGNGLPYFRRLIEYRKYYAAPYNWPFFTAYIEGWALYAESLGEEMGVYKGNDFFGKYASEVFRAARLVVDTGLHYYNWTYEEATDYLKNYTALPPHQIENELNRYIGWPGQAVSYKVGEIKIRQLREMAKKRLGDRFDLRSFNNATLYTGPVPLETLEAEIMKYIHRELVTAGAPRVSFSLFTSVMVTLLAVIIQH